jgi:hypothetical protein
MWKHTTDVRHTIFEELIEVIHEGRPAMVTVANRRGKIRTAHGSPFAGGQAHGAIPWYVPEGAEWDLHEEESTKRFIFGNRIGDSIESSEMVLEEDELFRYDEMADQLHLEEVELDQLDHAPMRYANRYYDDMPHAISLWPKSDAYLKDGLKNGEPTIGWKP